MNAIEFLIWCMTNENAPDAEMKARYETLCETEQHRLQKAIKTYGHPDESVTRLIGDDNYE